MRSGVVLDIKVNWDAAGLRRVDRTLGTYQGKELAKRAEKAMARELAPLTGALRSAEQGSGIHNRTNRHYRSIKVKRLRKRFGEMAAFKAGPAGHTAHLLIQGHRLVTPGGRDTGSRSRAFPYVQPVIDRESGAILDRLGSDVWGSSLRTL
jgi:hypothetical protein